MFKTHSRGGTRMGWGNYWELNMEENYIPKYKKLGLKSTEECRLYILAFLKKNEKLIANRGFGYATIKDGYGRVILELFGDKKLSEKRKKQTIRIYEEN